MPDRVYIDVHIAAKKVLRLRIVSTAEDFCDKNLSPAGCSEQPEQRAHQQSKRQKPGSYGRTQKEAVYFLKSSAPFLRAYA